jgi:hypothetical protein
MTVYCKPATAFTIVLLSTINVNANTTSEENSLPGTPPSIWDIPDAGPGNYPIGSYKIGDVSIDGFTNWISYAAGDTVQFKIASDRPGPYHIDIYRLGWYGGNRARLVATVFPTADANANQQPRCTVNSGLHNVDCSNWFPTATWLVPIDAAGAAPSGVYLGHIVRDDDPTSPGSHIPFVIRSTTRPSDIIVQTSEQTWLAYNEWSDGFTPNSLYGNQGQDFSNRTYASSYDRPFDLRSRHGGYGQTNYLFGNEYPMWAWLERNGYDVEYMPGAGVDQFPWETLAPPNHLVFLSIGHDEYWTARQRQNVEAARDAGLNLGFFSGNEIYWETYFSGRTMICYKTSEGDVVPPPGDPWTGTWAGGGNPSNSLTGQLFATNSDGLSPPPTISIPPQFRSHPLWFGTPVASTPSSQDATLPSGILGYEWDEVTNVNGALPSGTQTLSLTSVNAVSATLDYDQSITFGQRTVNHSLSLYQASSGAWVFGAGTVQWSWGLDDYHDTDDGNVTPPDASVQGLTRNFLSLTGAQPATPQ